MDCEDPGCNSWDVRCWEVPGPNCADGIDNDLDGLVDCKDPDCRYDGYCLEYGGDHCQDGIDNDLDGLVDCKDPDCRYDGYCLEYGGDHCQDGIDNDLDGLVDCEDPECPPCHKDEDCSNWVDDDGDGLADCDDPDCDCNPACTPLTETSCTNGIDDDCDGLVDCDDPDCRVDNDGDGFAAQPCGNDCDDNNSFNKPGQLEICDFEDNNCNGLVDENLGEICNNGNDDDCDGFADCADIDCLRDTDGDAFTSPPCGNDCDDYNFFINPGLQEICGDGWDNNCNGMVDEGCPFRYVTDFIPNENIIDFLRDKARIGIPIPVPAPQSLPFSRSVNSTFCEALKDGVEEILLELDDCDPITIPGGMLQSNKTKTKFSVITSTYALKIDCTRSRLKLYLKNINLEGCISNPVRFCATVKDGPSLCAEAEFEEVRDTKGRLKKLIYTGK